MRRPAANPTLAHPSLPTAPLADLRDQLQNTLGDHYTLERELGGGGMSRVFVAVESALHRRVVVKVLPHEMAASVSVERFKREIALAASNAENSGMTSLGVALGTPAYMSSEQAAANPNIDARADVYAFGIMAYELFAGRAPFAGRSPQAMLAAHVTEAPEQILKLRSTPPALASLIMRCLEKHPADRPQSAGDIVHALDAINTPSGDHSLRKCTDHSFLIPPGSEPEPGVRAGGPIHVFRA